MPRGPINLADYEARARELLPPAVYDWIVGGAEDEATVLENRAAFARRALRPRVLRDVSVRDLSVRLFDLRMPSPIVLAPTSVHRLECPDGELATARGAADAGVLLTLSTSSSVPLEEVAAAAPEAPRWFQLYTYRDRAHTVGLIRRATSAGYAALVVTADLPIVGRRERDLRNDFTLPQGVAMVHEPPAAPTRVTAKTSWAQPTTPGPTLTWEDLAWIREAWHGPLLVKGIVRGDDARMALERGADGVWVSNHGGRQLDGTIATLDALPDVAAAVGGRAPIIIDGGVRRGTDALKAIALGATAVAIGRPQLWGLAVAGADGVRGVVEMLRDELDVAMALAGCRSLTEVTPDLVTG